MKTQVRLSKTIVFAALLCVPGVLPARAQSASEIQIVASEIQKLVPAIRAIEDKGERDFTLRSTALALLRNFEAAQQISASISDSAARQKSQDDTWRYTARRLAWQGNIAAATRSANRIEGEYSRADTLLAVARAYLRTGDSAATQRVLKRVVPTIRAAQSPHAMSYLAYLFAQTGDAKTAHKLFAEARTFPNSDEFERDQSYDERRAIIAYYQVKYGWSEEAIATAGGELRNLNLAKSVLIARREWALLRAFADRLSLPQAIDFLLELSGTQLKANDGVAARASLRAAQARFSLLSTGQQNSENALPTQLRLALLEIANGNEAQGQARFAKISQSPHFNAKWEFAFYYLLIKPQNQSVLHSSNKERVSYEQKALAALARIPAAPYHIQPFDLLDIARAQKARGDLSAVRQTLQLAKSEIRDALLAPLVEDDDKNLRRARTANQLLTLARSERDAGLDYHTTLAQSQTLMDSVPDNYSWLSSPYLYGELMMRLGFFDEAVPFLKKTGIENADLESLGLLPFRAGDYAVAKGTNAALNWADQFKDIQARLSALTGVAIHLSGRSREKTELSLSGSKKGGAKVQIQFLSNYRPLFDVTPFLPRE